MSGAVLEEILTPAARFRPAPRPLRCKTAQSTPSFQALCPLPNLINSVSVVSLHSTTVRARGVRHPDKPGQREIPVLSVLENPAVSWKLARIERRRNMEPLDKSSGFLIKSSTLGTQRYTDTDT